MNKHTIDQAEYTRLCTFACDRNAADLVLDMVVANPEAVDDVNLRDEMSEIAREWDELVREREMTVMGGSEDQITRRKALVAYVYRVATE